MSPAEADQQAADALTAARMAAAQVAADAAERAREAAAAQR